ncbi:COG1470 family protein [Roseimaritima ulvae]|uniref:Large cysteine-rich periplasmic protein OmcB n=1 Tax=Roseimaritima ulvae TaxID=980254 RepID=A0A5B9R1Q6_9BACT|nr:DUF11 domain-containing protein [Roseimaritima ulvae]QEG40141.1 hypothetical protein UC8_21470 [Roseimaritima ulvae]
MRHAHSFLPTRLRPLTLFVAVLLAGISLSAGSGCTRLRLPQIDPTGACLFAPYPENSTQINPSCGCMNCLSGNGQGCLSRLAGQPRSCLKCLTNGGCTCGLGGCFKNMLPEPAFPEPATPPPCTPLPGAAAPPAICLPAPGCEDCADGPPAVLLGCEAEMGNLAKLPNRGKRGCILLSPQRIVAPVGGEVLLLSGVCGNDGYLMQREPLEWMLTPESVGHIIDVGDDDPGLVHRLAHTPKVDKRSGSYARGVTSTKVSLITRGNKNLRDDVRLEKGQTWISLSSPTEGTSRVTVLAPESECWDQRKATATIYWIDARWQFPGPQVAEKGTPVGMSTRVTRSEGAIPARGWIVRYEILNPELATFYSSGTAVDEVVVGEDGNAPIQLVPNPGTSGTAAVAMTVIRPAGESDNMPRMTLGQGRTTVTWSAAQLRVRAGAPQVAGYEQPFTVACEVANPGNLDARNVSVSVELPPGVSVQSVDSFARQLGNQIIWEIDSIPSQQQWEIQATLTSKAPILLRFQARAEQNLFAEDSVQVDIFRPSLSLGIQPVISSVDRVQVGDEVTFNIDITNTGERALENVQLESTGDASMLHAQTGVTKAFKDKQDGPLQPGDTWKVATTYIPTTPGQRCLTVTATADGGQTASDQSCITVINPIPATPAMAVVVEGRPSVLAGDDSVYFRYRVTNTGREPLTNVRVTTAYPPQLDVLEATQDGFDASELSQYKLNWLVAQIAPGQQAVFEARFRALQSLASGLVVLSVVSENGASASDQYRFDIFPAAAPPPTSTPVAPPLPPAQPPPSIPSAGNPRAPLPTAPPTTSPSDRNAAPPIAADTGSLRLRLVGLDNPAEVGGPIRFQLVVSNERDIPDSQVQLSFPLPAGTRIERITQTMNPGGEQIRESGGVIYLTEIRQLTARESVTYTIVLNSNQPQQIRFEVQGQSRLSPAGVAAVESVSVLAR